MDVLKAFVVFLLVIGTFAADKKRQGKCGSKPMNRERYDDAKRKYEKKPIPVHNDAGHQYNIKSDYSSDTSTPYETQTPSETQTHYNQDYEDYQSHPPSTSYGVSSRLSISPNGDVYKGRSLKHNGVRHFHEDDTKEHDHAHHIQNDEEDDQHHKIRTARSTSTGPSASSLNAISVGNSANAGENLIATASGLLVEIQSNGFSSTTGEGSSSSSGSTLITSGNRNGSSDETPEALSATLGTLGAMLQSQGSTHAAGQGSASVSGSTTNTVTSSNSFKSMKRMGKK